MEQVPRVGIVGNGKLAKHLVFYFNSLSIDIAHQPNARDLNVNSLKDCSTIWVLVSDDAIQCIAEKLRELGTTLIHCSGSLYDEKIIGVHPLMCFSDDLYNKSEYNLIPLVCDHIVDEPLQQVLNILENPITFISKENKELYHALCVLGGNLSTILWSEVISRSSEVGIDKDLFYPYMKKTIENLISTDSPLTGPIVRKDSHTINKNLKALEGTPFKEIYQSFLY